MSTIMVSLPKGLLTELDAEATRRSMTRSALLAVAVRGELARRDSIQVADAIARSERRFERAGSFEAEQGSFEAADLVRSDRDERR